MVTTDFYEDLEDDIESQEVSTKRCPRCQEYKSTQEFYSFANGRLSDYCKVCWAEKRKAYARKPRTPQEPKPRRVYRTETEKWCKRCNGFKPLSEFYKVGEKYSGYCKTHQNEYRKERRRAANPELKPRRTSRRLRTRRKEEGLKWCPKCQDYLSFDDFYKRGPNSHLFTSYCKTHHNRAMQRQDNNTSIQPTQDVS